MEPWGTSTISGQEDEEAPGKEILRGQLQVEQKLGKCNSRSSPQKRVI